jgi:hypothetical protein
MTATEASPSRQWPDGCRTGAVQARVEAERTPGQIQDRPKAEAAHQLLEGLRGCLPPPVGSMLQHQDGPTGTYQEQQDVKQKPASCFQRMILGGAIRVKGAAWVGFPRVRDVC